MLNKGAMTLQLNGVAADLGVEREREADAQTQWARGGAGVVSARKLVSGSQKGKDTDGGGVWIFS